VVCVTSGKGGTGKSVFTANLAVRLAQLGRTVTLLDADLGLANAHLLLDVSPTRNLLHLLYRDASLEEITVCAPSGVRLVSGGSGVHEIASLDRDSLFLIIRRLERLRRENDFLLVDTSAGIGPQTLMFLFASREIVLVTTRDLTSLTDGYAVIKTLCRRSRSFRVSVVVNRARSRAEARRAFERLRSATTRFLGIDLAFLGFLHEDPAVPASLPRKKTTVEAFAGSRFTRGIDLVAHRLLDASVPSTELAAAVRQALTGDGARAAASGSNGNGGAPPPGRIARDEPRLPGAGTPLLLEPRRGKGYS
jgi:flagellar biosynthesis protein FlhG